ncbi:MAG: CtsR family transcriptional regulator [bacterium]|nr:CtsR family transcriptional regulator [bacterium]
MPALCDLIEAYLHELLGGIEGGALEVRRSQLALRFGCAPSQINYVLDTRFTVERGYLVESRRGGRGCIRIARLSFDSPLDLLFRTYRAVGEGVSPASGHQLVVRLHEGGMLNRREAELMKVAVARGVLDPGDRARLLRSMLLCLLREGSREQALRGTGASP